MIRCNMVRFIINYGFTNEILPKTSLLALCVASITPSSMSSSPAKSQTLSGVDLLNIVVMDDTDVLSLRNELDRGVVTLVPVLSPCT